MYIFRCKNFIEKQNTLVWLEWKFLQQSKFKRGVNKYPNLTTVRLVNGGVY